MSTGVLKRHSVLPGFGLTVGYTLFYLSLMVLLPLSTLAFKSATLVLTPRSVSQAGNNQEQLITGLFETRVDALDHAARPERFQF